MLRFPAFLACVVAACSWLAPSLARGEVIPLDDFEDGDRLHALRMGWVAGGPAENVLSAPFDANPVGNPDGVGRRLELHVRLGAVEQGGGPHAAITCGVPESFAQERASETCGISFVHSGMPGARHVMQVHVREVLDGAHFEVALDATGQPVATHVQWSDLRQPSWGKRVGAFRPESMTGLAWMASGRAGLETCLTLDDVAFTTRQENACPSSKGLQAAATAVAAAHDESLLRIPRKQLRMVPASSLTVKGGTTVPADFGWGGGPLVEGRINGEGPFRLIFDTGAEVGMLTTAAAARLGLRPRGGVVFAAFHADAVGKAPITTIESMEVGGWEARGFDVLLTELVGPPALHVDGVIGVGLLRDLLVTLDGPAGTLRLEQGKLPRQAQRLLRSTTDILPHATIEVAGDELSCVLDTGSSGLFDLPAAAMTALVPDVRPVGWTSGADGVVRRDMVGRLKGDVRIGDATLRAPEISSDARHCSVGSAFFQHVVTTLDMRSRRVSVVRPGGEPIETPPVSSRGFYSEWRCGRHVVADVLPDSSAERAGLRAGASIRSIDGISVTTMTEDQVWVRLDSAAPVTLAVEGRPEDLVVATDVVLP